MVVTVGMPLQHEDKIFNCAVSLLNGQVLAVAPKTYLPNYREFYEHRHFAPAHAASSNMITIEEEDVPFGNDLIIEVAAPYGRVLRIHSEVCEDLWVPIPPSTEAALAGANILANLSASNITVGKDEYRQQLVIGSSGRNNAVQMYASAGFGESSTDLAWDGSALIAERGELLFQRTERFSLNGAAVFVDVDLALLALERARQNTFHENAAQYGNEARKVFRTISCKLWGTDDEKSSYLYRRLIRPLNSLPFVPNDPAQRTARCQEIINDQATGLARRLLALPVAARKAVIGVSGGLDSTLALLVTAKAMKLLGQPPTDIIAITMPGFGTTTQTRENAEQLIRQVGAKLQLVDITELSKAVFFAIGFDPATEGETLVFQNVQAWMRKNVELSMAAHRGGMVVGTGDLSELMLGWCTMFGDHASHYNPNGGVPKTLIRYLIEWFADSAETTPELAETLRAIAATPISPELLSPGAEGEIAQKTEQEIGPYELTDFFGYYLIRFGMEPSKIFRLAYEAFNGKYAPAELKKWLKSFLKRFFANQYKRSVLPDGPKVGLVSLSPRGDWRMPSDVSGELWIQDLDQVPLPE